MTEDKLRQDLSYAEGMCDLVCLVGIDDIGVQPGSDEAHELALNTIRRLKALWANHNGGKHGGAMGPSENACGMSDAPRIPGERERTLIALSFSRMVRAQGNGPECPYPEWMGRRWYTESGIVKATPRDWPHDRPAPTEI